MAKTKSPLTPAQVKELYRLASFYWREAGRCENAKAYLAGCVMLGSGVECALILFTDAYFDEALKTGVFPKGKGGAMKSLLDWTFAENLRVAKAAKWLPSGLKPGIRFRHQKSAKIGDYMELVRRLRNLVHAARYAQDHHRKRITKRYFDYAEEICGIAKDWLVEKVHSDLWPILMPGRARQSKKYRRKAKR